MINWNNGRYIDRLTLNGNTLKGKNQNGTPVWGKRINPGQAIVNSGSINAPKIDGEWEMTCISDIIFKFKLTLKQVGNAFYGDMVRTNGNEKLAKIEGEILSNDRIKFTRSIGNWKQFYTGEINQKSGSRATSFEGMFGFKDQLNHEWYAKALNK